MKKIDLGQTITILANIGVIAGIVFLAVELRQNNEIQSAQVRSTRVDNRAAITEMLFENPEVIEFLGKDRSSLSQVELDRIRLLGIRALVHSEWTYGEAIRGFQDLDQHASFMRTIYHRERLNYGLLVAWETFREVADPRFAAWFEENVVNER